MARLREAKRAMGRECPEPSVSRAKAPPVKSSEKGYGDENGSKYLGGRPVHHGDRRLKRSLSLQRCLVTDLVLMTMSKTPLTG